MVNFGTSIVENLSNSTELQFQLQENQRAQIPWVSLFSDELSLSKYE